MEYGRIEKYNDIYRVVSVTTNVELIGTCIRNTEFDYAIYPFTYNSFIMTNDALNDGNNVIIDADGLLGIQASGVISPTIITIEVVDESRNAVNKTRTTLLKEREVILSEITLPNVYRYLNHFYDMFELGETFGDVGPTKEVKADKLEIDTILNRIDDIDVRLNELNDE